MLLAKQDVFSPLDISDTITLSVTLEMNEYASDSRQTFFFSYVLQ